MKHWEKVAENLAVGTKTREDCEECNGRNTLVVSRNTKGSHAYCFKCDLNEHKSAEPLSLAEQQRLLELSKTVEAELDASGSVALPEDITYDIPLEGRLWLYKCGISESVWRKYKVCYSPRWQRVIIPIYHGDQLIWFQARSIIPEMKPKYLQPSADKSKVLFRSLNQQGDTVVLTEDMASAIRVGKHIPTMSILGTKLTNGQANYISKFDKVVVWLDSDKAGRDGSKKIRRSLGLLTDTFDILTDEDPKCLTDKRIREELRRFL